MPLCCIDPGDFFLGHMRNLCYDYMTNTKLLFKSPEKDRVKHFS